MEHLFEKLVRNSESGVYPCHMPGHKRRGFGELPEQLCRLDITEIEGFDNLHCPEGVLLELQKKAARLYGAEESFYLVNGSTCGILSAVSAALPVGGHILMARNCHKSAYHAAYLRDLRISYLYPEILEEYNICEAVTPNQVRMALEREPDIGAVLVVSPTYEGRIADIAGISEAAHERGIPLIVDEAHGAHLGLSRQVCESSCRQGADIIIQSVHKTLPALTQTALLHVNGSLADRELLRRFLNIYQSSSPSYLLMASIDNALQSIEKEGEALFSELRRRYEEMMTRLSECGILKFLQDGGGRQDLGKLVISVKDAKLTGRQLYETLLQKYGIQAEMAAEDFVLAMFTIGDGQEGYDRLTKALLEIDGGLEGKPRPDISHGGMPGGLKEETADIEAAGTEILGTEIPDREVSDAEVRRLAGAWDGSREEIPLEESGGRLAGEFVNLYPPGVPLLVPGEKITEGLRRHICELLDQGLTVQGIRLREKKRLIMVLKY